MRTPDARGEVSQSGSDSDLDPTQGIILPDEVRGDAALTDTEAYAIIRRYNTARFHARTNRANAGVLIRESEHAAQRILDEHSDRLKEWALSKIRPGRRSTRTLEGVIGFRKTPERLIVVDQREALAWAEKCCPISVETVVDPGAVSLVAFRVVDQETGEARYDLPPGFGLTGGVETFYIGAGYKEDE